VGIRRYHFLILLLVSILFSISIPNVFAAGVISEGFAIGEALPEWIGWAIVVGLGAVFAVIITIEIENRIATSNKMRK